MENKKKTSLNESVEFKRKIEQLKTEGWNGHNIPDPEKFAKLMLEEYKEVMEALAK
jgi:anti-sigma28 factor (negative regulator of flagellin synthesis)